MVEVSEEIKIPRLAPSSSKMGPEEEIHYNCSAGFKQDNSTHKTFQQQKISSKHISGP